jgi:hypothetical protein
MSSRHVLVESFALFRFVPPAEGEEPAWTRESILGAAFDNALRCLEPGGQPVGPCFVPAFRHWRQTPLFAFALETEPAVGEFARHDYVTAKRTFPALGHPSSIGEPVERVIGAAGPGAAVRPSSFCGCGCDQPHLPSPAARVQKGPVTHRLVLPLPLPFASRSESILWFARWVPR